jgi:hypothetical protein
VEIPCVLNGDVFTNILEKSMPWFSGTIRQCFAMAVFGKGTTSQAAEKHLFALVVGWRSGFAGGATGVLARPSRMPREHSAGKKSFSAACSVVP